MHYSKDLNRFSLINRRNLRYRDYTKSLISEALRVDLITIGEIDDLQMQIMGQLETLIQQMRENGTAVDDAVGKELLDGVFFTIDTALLSYHDPMYALAALQSETVASLYKIGQRQLRAHYLQTVNLYVQIRTLSLPMLIPEYDITLNEEIHNALMAHDCLFPTRSSPAFSYMLSNALHKDHQGIFLTKCYLETLLTEFSFFDYFRRETIDEFVDTHPVCTNAFTTILSGALNCAMVGRFSGELCLTEADAASLCERLSRRSLREITEMTHQAATTLVRDFHIAAPRLTVLIHRGARNYAKNLFQKKIEGTLLPFLSPC